jgi:hypothetical protein
MKNINDNLWAFVCTYIFVSKSAGKLLRDSVSDSIKHEVANFPINLKYDVIRNMRMKE